MNRIDLSALQPVVIAERFVVEREVARGGMGVVYRATDTLSSESVALKILYHGGARRRESTERFEQEAELLRRLVHPRVVSHIAHGEAGANHFYLAMQWLDGHDLGQRISKGPLPLRGCRRLWEKISEALAYMHAQKA